MFDGVIGDTTGCRVVDLDRCGWLWMSHLVKCDAYDSAFLCISEDGTDFGFSGRRHDILDDACMREDCAIVNIVRVVLDVFLVSKVEVATASAASLASVEIRCVAVDLEDHVTGLEDEYSIGMCMTVVEKFGGGFCSGFCTFGLGGGKCADRGEHGGIYCPSIVQKSTDDLL